MGKLGIDRKFTRESRSFIVGMIISYFVCFDTNSFRLLSRLCAFKRNGDLEKSRQGELPSKYCSSDAASGSSRLTPVQFITRYALV